MANNTDIVSLKWVTGLMTRQAESAELALVEYSKDATRKKALLQSMWSVHLITSTLRALGIKKGEMLSMEMERTLNFIYKEKVAGERRKLAMGGLMQALKILPAYLAHVQSARVDTGRGLESHVNDLRRWVGERPRPKAFFFYMDIPEGVGITEGASPAPDEEIRTRANMMLALYLEMAKSALRKRDVVESMKMVARISRKMQNLFKGTEVERFWFTLVGICEGVASGIIVPDECIAQLFKTGAFMIKYARENGAAVDPGVDYDSAQQQMLFYIASCRAKPVHISNIRKTFGITDETLSTYSQGLIHLDALVTALSGALDYMNRAVEFINHRNLAEFNLDESRLEECELLDYLEKAEDRLYAGGQVGHADALTDARSKLSKFLLANDNGDSERCTRVTNELVRAIVDVKVDVEYKLEHGLSSSFSSREFELRESVVTATFSQMSLVENYLHETLRRKALDNALKIKPMNTDTTMRLTFALNRYLNKTDTGHEALREAVRDAEQGEPDLDLLFDLAMDYMRQLESPPERQAIRLSLQLLADIEGALDFAGMARESVVIEQCRDWLERASKAGTVREDDAFRCFADAFAYLELHLQRSILDPLDTSESMLALAEQRAAELEGFASVLSVGIDAAEPSAVEEQRYVQDSEIPAAFREIFVEESEEIVEDLGRLFSAWQENPQPDGQLKDIRRHFHTFKGNGRAVGANILGELGWAAQDMLDSVLDGDLAINDGLKSLLEDVVNALPELVNSYRLEEGLNVSLARELTNRCFRAVKSSGAELAENLPTLGSSADLTATPAIGDSTTTQPYSH
jgi:HPt (histidine-containing phosphotransfer) domain-containing protein